MGDVRIASRPVGPAVVLTLPEGLSSADPAEVAEELDAAAGQAPLVVLDLRDVELLTAVTARVLVAFAEGCGERDADCVLLLDPSHTAAATVLDSVDPAGAVPRSHSFDEAVVSHRRIIHTGPVPVIAAVNTLAFDSVDLGRTEEFLSSSYAPMRISSSTGRSGAHITRVAAGPVSADRLDLSFVMSYDVAPLGRVCLCDMESGTVEDHRVDGWRETEAFGPGELFSFAPPDRPYTGRICGARYGITLLDPVLLDEVAGEPVRLLDHRPVDAAAAAQVRASIAHLRDDVLGTPGVGENPLVVSAVSRYLAASVLNAFPTTAVVEGSERDAHSATLRRAIAFIEANADRDIGAADIARAARVSVRAVQLAFRRHLDMTPMAYVRQVRLDCARAELRAAEPGETTVTEVAARWGYGRPSVFAARYRAAFGESPSQTLRDGGQVRFHDRPDFAIDATDGDPVLDQFESLTLLLLDATSVAEALQHVVDAAVLAVPGADVASVTMRGPDGAVRSAAWTDETAAELDHAQDAAGRGPVADVTSQGCVTSDDLGADTRWPEFAASAVERGYRAVIVAEMLPAAGPEQVSGALTIYSRRPGGLSRTDRDTALLLAMHGSLALAHVRTAELADLQRAQLRQAVDSRDLIGQAKGILMHRQGISADEAFDLLRRTSQDLNVKLVDLAHTLTTRHGELDRD